MENEIAASQLGPEEASWPLFSAKIIHVIAKICPF